MARGLLKEKEKELLGEEYFYFFDAAAPIVEKDSIDFNIAYYKSRYDKGENEYIISETSSSYVYCEDCGNMKEIALKQDMFDSILKSMDTYFKHTKVKSIYDLKVIVKLKDGFLVEEINGNILKKKSIIVMVLFHN